VLGSQQFNDTTYNPLKLDHGLGFDWADMDSFTPEEQAGIEGSKSRKINKMPFKVLDAPQLQDDFYLNLVDWSSSNVLAVGLNRAVYIWSACTS
jgi:WD40 repeat protein